MAVFALWSAPRALPFIPRALTWKPGERSEWRRSARWHVDVGASSGFERRQHLYPHTVENSPVLARFAAHHQPFYEELYAQRLDVIPWEERSRNNRRHSGNAPAIRWAARLQVPQCY
jgi:hypothetical protein